MTPEQFFMSTAMICLSVVLLGLSMIGLLFVAGFLLIIHEAIMKRVKESKRTKP